MSCPVRRDFATSGRLVILITLATAASACAQVAITPEPVQKTDPAIASQAIKAESIRPVAVVVQDFEFARPAIKENSSPIHRVIDLFRHTSAEERSIQIGREVAASLSRRTVKRLNQIGLTAARISSEGDLPLPDNALLVTGRLITADEGNRFTRVAVGFGFGESRLDTEVQVYRVAQGERAEVLAFTTDADSGKLPGVAAGIGFGELIFGPITLLSQIKDVASTGEKIYSTQLDRLASKTGDQVGRYISRYSAQEGWIPQDRAPSVKLSAS